MGRRKLSDQAKRWVMEHPTLMDDVPFTVAMRRSMALAQLIIRTTLSRDDLVVRKVHVQKGHFEDLPKRAEFYEAMLTVHSLEVGSHGYADMPHRCVIFICDGDVVGKGRPVYDYRWRLDDGEELGNGGCIVFVNGEYRADDAIGHLMADMDQSDPERAFNEECRRGGIERDERRDGEDTGRGLQRR